MKYLYGMFKAQCLPRTTRLQVAAYTTAVCNDAHKEVLPEIRRSNYYVCDTPQFCEHQRNKTFMRLWEINGRLLLHQYT